MDIRKVKKLIELLEESSLSEIEIHEGDETVRISRAAHMPPAQVFTAPPAVPVPPCPPPATETTSVAKEDAIAEVKGTRVTSPIVGTFYRSPAPNEPPFVKEGDTVKQGEPVCIIEAMKMMNHIDAPADGIVSQILVADGDPVEYGQTLMIIET